MKKRKSNVSGKILTVLGVLCLVAAAALFVYNFMESEQAGEASRSAIEALIEKNHERGKNLTTLAPDETAAPTQAPPDLEEEDFVHYEPVPYASPMPVESIDGRRYLGVLTFPTLGNLELPVQADFSMKSLKKTPCWYSGSYIEDNFVVAGHNYRRHFSRVKRMSPGEEVIFTAVDGTVIHYVITDLETIKPKQIKEMITGDDWDMTLFTCTPSGTARCAVRCVRKEEVGFLYPTNLATEETTKEPTENETSQ